MTIDFSNGLEHFRTDWPKNAVDGLIGLKLDFESAEEKGLFVPLPKSEPDRSKDVSRIKTIRNRLANLGYLETDSGRSNLNDELRDAIRSFQEEAGLEVDGWVGAEETWPALQELVSFETPINVPRWFKHGKPIPALRRAIGLRLFVLGLTEKKPESVDLDLDTGFETFSRIWNILSPAAEDAGPPSSNNMIWIGRLFDQDGIVERLAGAAVPFSTDDLRTIHSLVINVTKIELWLMGYRVRPTGYDLKAAVPLKDSKDDLDKFDMWMRSSSVTSYLRIRKNLTLYKALYRFWRDRGEDKKKARHLSLNFFDRFHEFFDLLASGLQTYDAMSVKDRHKLIEEKLQQHLDQVPTIWTNLQRVRNRIWDGVKRVWTWIKSIVKKVIDFGLNLSRLIYNYALGAFSVVSNIFESLGEALSLVTNRYLKASDPNVTVFFHDGDFDFKVAVNSLADKNDVEEICANLKHQMKLFLFVCHLMGIFISVLQTVLKTVSASYVGLVIALVKFRSEWQRVKEIAVEYRQVFQT
jgi:hypothetical protein